MSSLRLSVCDVGKSGPYRLKILKTNCADNWPNIFALRSPKVIHLLPGEHGEILERLEVGWKKWPAGALKRQYLWRTHRKSPTLFQMVPSATPYDLFFPGSGFTTPTKTPIAIISGTAKATHFKFSMHIHTYSRSEQKSIKKI